MNSNFRCDYADYKTGNLIYITHSYNNFQKDPIEMISNEVKNINVLVRANPLAEISNIFPIKRLERLKVSNKIDLSNKPPNICIHSTPIYYLPGDWCYKFIGEKHYCAVEKAIKNYNLKFDLIHAHFIWSSGYVGARLKEKYRVPFVVTAHGYDIYDIPFRDTTWKKKIEYVLNTADYIITVSQSNLDCINRLDVSTPVKVIPNGFRSDLFYPQDPVECKKLLNLRLDKKIILTVGNLESIKGHKYLIEAISNIVQERNDIQCIIVGSGRLHNVLEQQIQSLDLKNYVTLVGGKSHDEIPLWMNACDLFVLPSLNEGNPTVMFETLGCGKPFVGTKVGGVPEIISSEDYGLLVESADPEDLTKKIMIALSMEWDQEKILQYAERFTWENITEEILTVYQEIKYKRTP